MKKLRDAESRQDYVEIACEIRGQTELAFRIFDGARECWLPKSQIQYPEYLEGGGHGIVLVPEWLAKEKGLL